MLENMENKKRDENLLMVLSSRRKVNAKNQLKSVLLEMLEIFGPVFVEEVETECKCIYNEFLEIINSNASTNE